MRLSLKVIKLVSILLAALIPAEAVLIPCAEASTWSSFRSSNLSSSESTSFPFSRTLPQIGGPGIGLLPVSSKIATISRTLQPSVIEVVSQASAFLNLRAVSAPKVSSRIVLHFQDVHHNLEAQNNLRLAIEQLSGKISMVALEGDGANLPLSSFQRFSNSSENRRRLIAGVADHLLKIGGITGPVAAGLTAKPGLTQFVGIDDPALYRKNVQTVREALSRQPYAKSELESIGQSLERRKASVFNSSLLTFDRSVQRFRRDQVLLGDHVQLLASLSPEMIPEFETFLEALHSEGQLDETRIERERSHLIETLLPRLSSSERDELTALSLAYKSGRLSHADFYSSLSKLCQRRNVDLDFYPNLRDYIQYVFLADSVDPEKLLEKISQVEEETYHSLAKTEEEKDLIEASKQLGLAEKLVRFQLTSKEWKKYKKIAWENRMSMGSRSLFNEKHLDLMPFSHAHENLSPFRQFYELAEARDGAMATNFLRRVNGTSDSIAILVTGGFHTDGILQKLSDQGLTVISFSPKLCKLPEGDGSEYLNLFTQEKTPLDRLFEGEPLFLSPKPGAELDKAPFEAAALGALAKIGTPTETLRSLAPRLKFSNVHFSVHKDKVQGSVTIPQGAVEVNLQAKSDGEIANGSVQYLANTHVLAALIASAIHLTFPAIGSGTFAFIVLWLQVKSLIWILVMLDESAHLVMASTLGHPSRHNLFTQQNLLKSFLTGTEFNVRPEVKNTLKPGWQTRLSAGLGLSTHASVAVYGFLFASLAPPGLSSIGTVLAFTGAATLLMSASFGTDFQAMISGLTKVFACGILVYNGDRQPHEGRSLLPSSFLVNMEQALLEKAGRAPHAIGAGAEVSHGETGEYQIFSRRHVGGQDQNPFFYQRVGPNGLIEGFMPKLATLTDELEKRGFQPDGLHFGMHVRQSTTDGAQAIENTQPFIAGEKPSTQNEKLVPEEIKESQTPKANNSSHKRFVSTTAPKEDEETATVGGGRRVRYISIKDGKLHLNKNALYQALGAANGDLVKSKIDGKGTKEGAMFTDGDMGEYYAKRYGASLGTNDSERATFKMYRLRTQGVWRDSLQLAFDREFLVDIHAARPSNSDIELWSDRLEQVFLNSWDKLYGPQANSLTDITHGKEREDLVGKMIEALRHFDHWEHMDDSQLRPFVDSALSFFTDNDGFRAAQIFIDEVSEDSTFGLFFFSTLERRDDIYICREQPVAVVQNRTQRTALGGSVVDIMAAAMQRVVKEGDDLRQISLNMKKDIAADGSVRGGEVARYRGLTGELSIYSVLERRILTSEEIEKRWEPPFKEDLIELPMTGDTVGDDIQAASPVGRRVHQSFRQEGLNDTNNQTSEKAFIEAWDTAVKSYERVAATLLKAGVNVPVKHMAPDLFIVVLSPENLAVANFFKELMKGSFPVANIEVMDANEYIHDLERHPLHKNTSAMIIDSGNSFAVVRSAEDWGRLAEHHKAQRPAAKATENTTDTDHLEATWKMLEMYYDRQLTNIFVMSPQMRSDTTRALPTGTGHVFNTFYMPRIDSSFGLFWSEVIACIEIHHNLILEMRRRYPQGAPLGLTSTEKDILTADKGYRKMLEEKISFVSGSMVRANGERVPLDAKEFKTICALASKLSLYFSEQARSVGFQSIYLWVTVGFTGGVFAILATVVSLLLGFDFVTSFFLGLPFRLGDAAIYQWVKYGYVRHLRQKEGRPEYHRDTNPTVVFGDDLWSGFFRSFLASRFSLAKGIIEPRAIYDTRQTYEMERKHAKDIRRGTLMIFSVPHFIKENVYLDRLKKAAIKMKKLAGSFQSIWNAGPLRVAISDADDVLSLGFDLSAPLGGDDNYGVSAHDFDNPEQGGRLIYLKTHALVRLAATSVLNWQLTHILSQTRVGIPGVRWLQYDLGWDTRDTQNSRYPTTQAPMSPPPIVDNSGKVEALRNRLLGLKRVVSRKRKARTLDEAPPKTPASSPVEVITTLTTKPTGSVLPPTVSPPTLTSNENGKSKEAGTASSVLLPRNGLRKWTSLRTWTTLLVWGLIGITALALGWAVWNWRSQRWDDTQQHRAAAKIVVAESARSNETSNLLMVVPFDLSKTNQTRPEGQSVSPTNPPSVVKQNSPPSRPGMFSLQSLFSVAKSAGVKMWTWVASKTEILLGMAGAVALFYLGYRTLKQINFRAWARVGKTYSRRGLDFASTNMKVAGKAVRAQIPAVRFHWDRFSNWIGEKAHSIAKLSLLTVQRNGPIVLSWLKKKGPGVIAGIVLLLLIVVEWPRASLLLSSFSQKNVDTRNEETSHLPLTFAEKRDRRVSVLLAEIANLQATRTQMSIRTAEPFEIEALRARLHEWTNQLNRLQQSDAFKEEREKIETTIQTRRDLYGDNDPAISFLREWGLVQTFDGNQDVSTDPRRTRALDPDKLSFVKPMNLFPVDKLTSWRVQEADLSRQAFLIKKEDPNVREDSVTADAQTLALPTQRNGKIELDHVILGLKGLTEFQSVLIKSIQISIENGNAFLQQRAQAKTAEQIKERERLESQIREKELKIRALTNALAPVPSSEKPSTVGSVQKSLSGSTLSYGLADLNVHLTGRRSPRGEPNERGSAAGSGWIAVVHLNEVPSQLPEDWKKLTLTLSALERTIKNPSSAEVLVVVHGAENVQQPILARANQVLSREKFTSVAMGLSPRVELSDGRWDYRLLLEEARRENQGGLPLTTNLLKGITAGLILLSISRLPERNAIEKAWDTILKSLDGMDLSQGELEHQFQEMEVTRQQT